MEVGRVGYDPNRRKASFQYNPGFLMQEPFKKLFPYVIRKTKSVQVFSEFEGDTFRGLPPMIADSLPDMFGNIVFKEWLETGQKDINAITPLEQLTYVGSRAMGALEFFPAKELDSDITINLDEITEVVKKVLDVKTAVKEKNFSNEALFNIFKIGTSAGGARPKILVSENKKTGHLIAGDIETSADYNHYLIKLGIDNELYSKEVMEYVYYRMATTAKIDMMPSKLIDNLHFATLRFDRQNGEKQHILTASGITGWDMKNPEHATYENLFRLALDLSLPQKDIEMLFRRMVFNIVFANTDDHLKNFSFIYNDNANKWNLAPAYDLAYPLDALKKYLRTSRAMSVNGKRVDIQLDDILKTADLFTVKNAKGVIRQVVETTTQFRPWCVEHHIPVKVIDAVERDFMVMEV